MRSVTPMRAAKTGYIIMSVLLCVLGVVLFVWPGVSVTVIGELLGIGMIVFGAVKVAGYLSRDLFRLAFQYDLAFGVLLIALGIVTLTHPGETIGFLCVVYGILVLSDGLLKVQIAVDAKRFGIDRWWAILLAAACAVPAVLWGSFAPLAAAVGYGLAVWHGFRQFDGMSGDISGFGLVLGELCGAAVLAIGG